MAEKGGKLYFSPKYTFEEVKTFIDRNDKDKLIKAFEDRVYGFYLNPAKKLNEIASETENNVGFSFSVILICSAMVDFLGLILTGEDNSKERFRIWLESNIPEFKTHTGLASKFYDWYRCGLVHEGRIKSGAQVSYKYDELIYFENEKYIKINPNKLLSEIEKAFEKYICKLRENDEEFERLKTLLYKKFVEEFRYVARHKTK